MRVPVLLCLLLALAPPLARAQCQCLWQGSFSDVQAGTDLVVSGTVAATKGNSIDLAVSRVLRGPEPPDPLRIWLQTADYCRPDVALFPVGSSWLMALSRITEDVPDGFNPNTPNISYGRLGDYTLSSCGGYWLRVSGNGTLVTGNLVKAPRWERDPPMTPVLLDLVVDFVQGRLSDQQLLEASRENPALRQLELDTRSFLRNEN
ncbi:MAG: delta-aminolevulinic acid dehydratase [Halioglobus sp.]|nr:delta-aminolevulinic acid dehydratase [Halioglobus sp.]